MIGIYQTIGALAILVGLAGTWMAARNKVGWLLCVASSAMWLPALLSGRQWAAVANCGLSIAICVRNFTARSEAPQRTGRELELSPR
jgi:hypothetical protein